MRPRVNAMLDHCTLEVAMTVIGGTWKLSILKYLFPGPLRFGELGRTMPEITPRMLTRQLRELEEDGIVTRTVHPEIPPRVEYSLTDIGMSLKDLAERLEEWGHWYRRQVCDPLAGSEPAPRRVPGSPGGLHDTGSADREAGERSGRPAAEVRTGRSRIATSTASTSSATAAAEVATEKPDS